MCFGSFFRTLAVNSVSIFFFFFGGKGGSFVCLFVFVVVVICCCCCLFVFVGSLFCFAFVAIRRLIVIPPPQPATAIESVCVRANDNRGTSS